MIWLDGVAQDVRYGVRQLRRGGGFTAAAILTLALGIGANTAIFTLVNAVMLDSLPVDNPSALYTLGDGRDCCVMGGVQQNMTEYSLPLYRELRAHLPEMADMAAFQGTVPTVGVHRAGSAAAAEPSRIELVSDSYFRTLGVRPAAGRLLSTADDQLNAPPVVVLSYHVWHDRFALDPRIIGSSLIFGAVPATVVGVAPSGFNGETLGNDPPEFWLPLATEPLLHSGAPYWSRADLGWVYLIGRLRPDARPPAVEAHVNALLRQWMLEQPWMQDRDRRRLAHMHMALTPAGGGVKRRVSDYADGLRLLLLISALLLAIACANIANLLLARGMATRLQTAVRMALGAERWRLIRQTVTEGILLALAGGAAGLAVAYGGTRAILALAFRGAHFVPIDPQPSLTVLGFTALLCLATGVLFSAAPAWIASRTHPAEPLRGAGRGTRSRESMPQRSLVVLQAALSLVLLAGAGLLSESLRRLEGQRFGFQTAGRVVAQVDLELGDASPARLDPLYREMRQRLGRIPGVVSASLSLYGPMEGENWSLGTSIDGKPIEEGRSPSLVRVSPRYFETIGSRLLRGRTIGEEDTPSSRRVTVVNETFARRFLAGGDPLGRHLGLGSAAHGMDYEVVGVVEDAKYADAKAPAYATLFLPLLQDIAYSEPFLRGAQVGSNQVGSVQLRVAGQPRGLQAAVRRVLADLDPNAVVVDMASLDEEVQRNFNNERLVARLASLYGGLALILACTGLYGVASYTVVRRTREMGLRMALGADRGGVVLLVLRGALKPILLGLAIGVPAALAAGRAMASQLFDVRPFDAPILASAVAILVLSAAFAAFLPARRAAAAEPMNALRSE